MNSTPSQVKPKTIKLVFGAFLLSIKEREHRMVGSRIMWLSSDSPTCFTIKIQLCVLVQYNVDIIIIIISLQCNLFSPSYSWNIAHLQLNNNLSLYMTFPVLYWNIPVYCKTFISVFQIEKPNVFLQFW